jgi:hypothetical protein
MTERLRTTGFLFTRTEIAAAVLSADYGDAYRSPGAVIGAQIRNWTAKVDVLTDDPAYGLIEGLARAEYLWQFWQARKAADDEPFLLHDYKDDLYYLASFTEDELTFEMLCSQVFSTGVQFRERRIAGLASPLAGLPIEDEQAAADILDESGAVIYEEGIY